MKHSNIRSLTMASLMAAMCCVATMVIQIPTIGTNGYVNLGDTLVLLSAWLLGGLYGAMAAGIGAALADFLVGYAVYAPGTFVIKFAMAFLASILYNKFKKNARFRLVAYVLSALAAEIVMILGYFIYGAGILGYGWAALTSIGSNAMQGAVCLVLGVAAVRLLDLGKARTGGSNVRRNQSTGQGRGK